MSAAPQTSSPHADAQRRESKYWWGLFGGALAWLAHLLLSYLIAEFGCESRMAAYSFLEITAVTWTLAAVSLATLLAAVGAALLAHRNCKAHCEDRDETHDAMARRQAARIGLAADWAFAFVIVFESVPILYYLQHC